MSKTYNDYPQAAINNAKRALDIKEDEEKIKNCGTAVGWRRARQLAGRENISRDTVARMASFNRHRQNSQGDPREDCGALMWLAWGGDAGINWAINKMEEIKEEEKKAAQKNNLYLGGEIEDFSSYLFNEQLNTLDTNEPIQIIVESAGGNVFAGQSIYSKIKEIKGTTFTRGRGIVASIASVILLAGDVVTLEENAVFMIHNSWGYQQGEAEDFRKTADVLDKLSSMIVDIYVQQIKKTNKLVENSEEKTREKVKQLMNEETWLTPNEAKDLGFIDIIVPAGADMNEKAANKSTKSARKENIKIAKAYAKAPSYFFNKYDNQKNMSETKDKKSIFAKLAEAFGMMAKEEVKNEAAAMEQAEATETQVEEMQEAAQAAEQKEMTIEEMQKHLEENGYTVHAKEKQNAISELENKLAETQKKLMQAKAMQLGATKEIKSESKKTARETLVENAAASLSKAFDQIRRTS